MKKIIVFLLLAIYGLNAQPIIIDHSSINYSTLSKERIEKIIAKLRVGYQHTSHGSQLVSGLNAIAKYNPHFKFPISESGLHPGIFFNDYAMPNAADLGHSGDLDWAKATVGLFNNKSNDRNVIMWSWCGGVSDNTEEGINAYLKKMNELEQQFLNTYFVYMTGHLDGSGKNGNLNKMNNIIREYCKANNKILFDFADIESYAPGIPNNLMELNADDACNVDYNLDGTTDGNWATMWMLANLSNDLAKIANQCTECAHSENLNCALKGVGTWKLFDEILKKIETSGIEDSTALNKDPLFVYPNPVNKILNIRITAKKDAVVDLDIFDLKGKSTVLITRYILKQEQEVLTFDVSNLPVGHYEIRAKIDLNFYNKPIVKE